MGLCLPAGSHTAIEMSRQRAQKAPSSASRPAAERRLGRLGAALALAAVVHQVAHQAIHGAQVGAVKQLPAVALGRYQVGLREFLEVKRQVGARQAQHGRQAGGREARRPCTHERAKNAQPSFMRQGGEGGDGSFFIHGSSIVQALLKQVSSNEAPAPQRWRSSTRVVSQPSTKPQKAAPMPKMGWSATVTKKHTSAPSVAMTGPRSRR